MKSLLISILCSVALSAAADAGRYQLVSGGIQVLGFVNGEAVPSQKPAMFKIDTATGETWIFEHYNADGKQARGWVKLDALSEKQLDTVLRQVRAAQTATPSDAKR